MGLTGAVMIHRAAAARRSGTLVVAGVIEAGVVLFVVVEGFDAAATPAGQLVETRALSVVAISCMAGTIFEAIFGFFHRLNYSGIYVASMATPLTPGNLVLGEALWAACNGFVYGASVLGLAVGTGFASVSSVPISAVGLAISSLCFAGVGVAAASLMRSYTDFEFVQVYTFPAILVSGAVVPISEFPWMVEHAARLSPLYHAVELQKDLFVDSASSSAVGHTAVLVTLAGVGVRLARTRVATRLRP